MAGQWPAEVLDSMKYKGEHLESLLTPNLSSGQFDSDGWCKAGADMQACTEGRCVLLTKHTRVSQSCSYFKQININGPT